MRIDRSVASILLFKIDILLSSKSIKLGFKLTRAEVDDKVELGKVFRLSYLLTDQSFSSQKIFKILVIHNNVDRKDRTF